MDNLLYYPYINLPKIDWTVRTLLYYDSIASIVPQQYFYEPSNYEPFMRNMVANELVIPINPIEALDNPWDVSRKFIDYVNTSNFGLNRRLNHFRKCSITDTRRDQFIYSVNRIHVDKFENEIFRHLEDVGLAVRESHDWYIVEQKTADELMTFLATVIGAKLNYQPTTDEIRKRFSLNRITSRDFDLVQTQGRKRELILKELIPFPEEIDIKKLRKFKDKHPDLLKSFRNKIELVVLNPTIEMESPFFDESIRELKFRKDELSAKMNESKLGNIFFGSICGIVGATIGLAATSGWGAALGVPGFANAIYSALQIEKAENIFDQSGLKYLALVDKKLRKNK